MGIVFKNNAKTTLASSLSNSATSATVTDGSVFPTLGAGEFFLITFDDGTNNEICKCTARSSNTLTIVRAQDNTSARAFSSGDAAEGRVTAGVLETIQENIAAKSADQTVYNATTASSATAYDIGIDPGVEANAMVFLDGVMQHHDTFSFSGSTLTFDAAPTDGTKLEVIVDNLINLQSSNLTVDSFTAADVGGSAQTAFTLSDTPAAETNLIVFVDGVFQDQDAYTISSSTLTITTGVIAGRGVTVYVINPVNIGTPSDGTITSAKLSGNITMPGTLTVGANDVAFDSPTFVVDNSNSRVGLGTASPTVPVDIVGETKMSSHLTLGTTSKVQFGDTGTYIHQSADGVLDLVSDNEIEINATTVDVNGALDVSGNITGTLATAAQTNITSVGTLTALTVDDITINGSTISDASHLTIDAEGVIKLDANGGEIQLLDGGTEIGVISMGSQNINIESKVADKDIKFKGIDGSSDVTALTLDMSNNGRAIFNAGGTFNDHVYFADGNKITLGGGDDFEIYHIADSVNVIRGPGAMVLQSDDYISLGTHSDGELMLKATKNGAVDLYYDNVVKLSTTSGGVIIDGVSNYNGLEVKGTGASRPSIKFSNVTQGLQAQLYGTEGNALVIGTGTSSVAAMTIDSSQRVNMPGQPCFSAALPAATNGGNVIVWGGEHLDVGGHFNTSNGKFTAPVAGNYFFSFWILLDPASAGAYSRVLFRKNGSASTQWTDNLESTDAGATAAYHSVGGSCVMPLAANDYVETYNDGQNPTYGTAYGNWSGFLVS